MYFGQFMLPKSFFYGKILFNAFSDETFEVLFFVKNLIFIKIKLFALKPEDFR